jgi:hypothetical protein
MMSTRLSPPTKRPSSLQYVQHFAGKGMVANKDANLTTVYQPDEDVPYIWKRNLRIVNQAILDAVDMRAVGPWLCRKTIWPKDETEYEQQRAFEASPYSTASRNISSRQELCTAPGASRRTRLEILPVTRRTACIPTIQRAQYRKCATQSFWLSRQCCQPHAHTQHCARRYMDQEHPHDSH